jgi:hypothetical protein
VEDSGADGKENMKYRIKTVGEKKRTSARGAASRAVPHLTNFPEADLVHLGARSGVPHAH